MSRDLDRTIYQCAKAKSIRLDICRRYLYRQDQAIKAAKAEEAAAAEAAPAEPEEPKAEEAAAEAEPAPEEPASEEPAPEAPPAPKPEPEKTPLMAQVEADIKALQETPSLPALWYAYGNLTARIGKSSLARTNKTQANMLYMCAVLHLIQTTTQSPSPSTT